MATKKKLLQAAAGNAGGEALNVEDVFSTYLYTGNSSTQTITNGIDLAGKGGMVWHKRRDSTGDNFVFDTERGVDNYIYTNLTNANTYNAGVNYSFNADGFSLNNSFTGLNGSGNTYASWTFRKAPKFFDVVTYTGDGVSGREIAHNLGTTVGTIIVKKTDSALGWAVYHKDTGNTKILLLNDSGTGFTNAAYWNNTSPTDTNFTVGASSYVNGTGATYVAYLFAHNDGDGEFGSTADQDIIKCGSYTGNGSTDGPEINLGFEPQWILIKNTTTSNTGWSMWDNMRGVVTGGNDAYVMPQASSAEASYNGFAFNATGFKVENTAGFINTNGNNYIYIAIRRGPMAGPESATDVFAMDASASSTDPSWSSNFPVDFNFYRDPSGGDNWYTSSRLTGNKFMYTNSTGAELSDAIFTWDYMDGWGNRGANTGEQSWMWRRAPSFFDVVAYTGAGAGTTFSHNLGVAPEMIWVKNRSRASTNWNAYHKDLELNGVSDTAMDCVLYPSLTNSITGITDYWGSSGPSDTQVTLGANNLQSSFSGDNYIAYLFASLDGVSKVGSYTGNGSTQTIDCGFSSGARFVLIKRTYSTGDWYIWDTERGIVAANDPHLSLNTTAAEVTTDDSIDPVSSGFAVNQVAATNINVSSATYIYYAIA